VDERRPEQAFLFADLAGYTALTEAHGDEGAAAIATAFHTLVRASLGDEGRLVKTLGDGVMIVAPSCQVAIEVARRIRDGVAEHYGFPTVRLGLHHGTAVERDGDYFGNAVNLTARVMEAARPGQVLATVEVAREASASGCAEATPMGTVHFKHVTDPVTLYRLGFDRPATTFVYLDPVCRMQVPADAPSTVTHAGGLVRFCSSTCAERFARDPSAFLLDPAELPVGLSEPPPQRA